MSWIAVSAVPAHEINYSDLEHHEILMNVLQTPLAGVLLLEPRIFKDDRGWFFESYHEKRYWDVGLTANFVQDNHSHSSQGTLRGLHYQLAHPQGKLVRVVTGEAYDVCVDIRRGSSTFGQWYGVYLSGDNHLQLYVPPGFAHGFCVVSKSADFLYKCTDFYTPGDEYGIRWDDPQIGIEWPIAQPLLSDKDARAPLLKDAESVLPTYNLQ
jgi:dTDP-4-dehydrorhamnose 3,5-epimerase